MEFEPIRREPGSFQETVRAADVVAMSRRAFGEGVEPISARELGAGRYNNTYRVELRGRGPAILRVAPDSARQSRLERSLMRNEYASLPYFAPIASMMPRTLFADWTHEIVERDYVWQTLVDGVPAPDGLGTYPRSAWLPYYRQLGAVTGRVHAVRGTRFGPVAGPSFATWSETVLWILENTAADFADAGLDGKVLGAVIEIAAEHTATLDIIGEPRLLHGDLWTPNVMLAAGAPEPTVVGVLDHDRALWGDPAADWGIFVAATKPPEAQHAFRETYGPPDPAADARLRALIYRALHIGATTLERHRLRDYAKIPSGHDDLRVVLNLLAG